MIIKLIRNRKAIIVIKTVLSVLISALLAKIINIASLVTIIPKAETFSISFTIYLTLIELVYSDYLEPLITSKISEIKINITDLKENTIKDKVLFVFKDLDISYVYGYINIKAMPKRLKQMKIKIVFPNWITVQNSKKDDGDIIEIDPENKCICYLNINKLINVETTSMQDKTFNFKLNLIKNKQEIDREENIVCYLIDNGNKFHKKFIDFNHNDSYIKS